MPYDPLSRLAIARRCATLSADAAQVSEQMFRLARDLRTFYGEKPDEVQQLILRRVFQAHRTALDSSEQIAQAASEAAYIVAMMVDRAGPEDL